MKRSYVWEQAEIDVSGHISTVPGITENQASPYLTLLKPRSLPPNPWAASTTEETIGMFEPWRIHAYIRVA